MKDPIKKSISLTLVFLMICFMFPSTLFIEVTARDEGYLWPVPHTKNITSYYGKRSDPFTGETSFHRGIDISATMKNIRIIFNGIWAD